MLRVRSIARTARVSPPPPAAAMARSKETRISRKDTDWSFHGSFDSFPLDFVRLRRGFQGDLASAGHSPGGDGMNVPLTRPCVPQGAQGQAHVHVVSRVLTLLHTADKNAEKRRLYPLKTGGRIERG